VLLLFACVLSVDIYFVVDLLLGVPLADHVSALVLSLVIVDWGPSRYLLSSCLVLFVFFPVSLLLFCLLLLSRVRFFVYLLFSSLC